MNIAFENSAVITVLGIHCRFLQILPNNIHSKERGMLSKLNAFDEYLDKILKDWNAPSVGVGIMEGNELIGVELKKRGYRHIEWRDDFSE